MAAIVSKNKGNDAFKAGNYDLALAHYSTAIQQDPSDFTFPLNRALCYLRLEKWTAAEKDATKALSLEPGNAKALYRRGLAKKGSGKLIDARSDFLDAKKAGAGSEVDKELESMGLAEAAALPSKTAQTSSAPTPTSSTPPPAELEAPLSQAKASRLRAAITPESVSKPPAEEQFMKEVSTKRTKPAPLSTNTFAAQKEQRSTRLSVVPRAVSSPIIPSQPAAAEPVNLAPLSTSSSPPAGTSRTASTPSKPPAQLFNSPSSSLPPPPTGAAFELAWSAYPSPASRLSLLQSYDPTTLPALFQSSLTPDLLSDIISSLSTAPPLQINWLLPFLKGMSGVPRFDALVGFLDEKETKALNGLFAGVRKDVDELARSWNIE